jgi:hypothetical protein
VDRYDKPAVEQAQPKLTQIGMITLDNASNCNTMMRDVGNLLRAKGIAFDSEGNRIRWAV